MRESLRLYQRYIGIAIRGQMQYRASFLMLTFGQLLVTIIEFVGIIALFQRFGGLRGWTLPEVALFYGLVNIAFAIADGIGRGFDTFSDLVKTGDFDRLLLRPRSTVLQVAGREVLLTRVGRLMQGLFVFGWAVWALHLAWTPAKVLLVLAMIGGGTCLFVGLFVLQATLAFWTVESLEVMNTVTYGGTQTGQYPLTIYRPWFRRFFTFIVPVACVNYLPGNLLLDRPDPYGASAAMQWGSPLVGLLFLLLSLRVWEFGVRHYRSTGS